MSKKSIRVENERDLVAAVSGGAGDIEVRGTLRDLPTIRLSRGQCLRAASPEARLQFAAGAEGIGLAGDNELTGLSIATDLERRAIYIGSTNAAAVLGQIVLRDLVLEGQLQCMLAGHDRLRSLLLSRVTVTAADATGRSERPHGNGVSCLQGAVTVWNRATQDHELLLRIDGLEIGSPGAPVRGSGLFVAGAGAAGSGRVRADLVRMGAVYCDSGLSPSETQTICGGTFILPGAKVIRLLSHGAQTTFGPNAVSIDNWGEVTEWIVDGGVTTHGPNAVAVVNAGELGRLEFRDVIETFGDGARACAIYGPAADLRFGGIRTHGSAAAGIHIVDRVGRLEVGELLDIQGRSGIGMVKGRMERLQADGVHIERGGHVATLVVPNVRLADPGALAIRDDARA